MSKSEIKEILERSLIEQGFSFVDGRLFNSASDKDAIRNLHKLAVKHKQDIAGRALARKECELLKHFADVNDLDFEKFNPTLVEVLRGSQEELLFRYACLQWSIPISSGYGRRLRFLVVDDHNGKLVGVIGLGDPVYSLSCRDKWIGWTPLEKKERLQGVMDAFVLGAVPPYSKLLCGKLVAMLVASSEIQFAFQRKYGKSVSYIGNRVLDGKLAMVTTCSALGKSSMYNRLTFEGEKLFVPVGYTIGSGEFQFLNGTYEIMREYAKEHCTPSLRHSSWGSGFRNRRELVKKVFQDLELPYDWLFHGIKRQVFVVPLAQNTREYLQGRTSECNMKVQGTADLVSAFRSRWLDARLGRIALLNDWNKDQLRLWP